MSTHYVRSQARKRERINIVWDDVVTPARPHTADSETRKISREFDIQKKRIWIGDHPRTEGSFFFPGVDNNWNCSFLLLLINEEWMEGGEGILLRSHTRTQQEEEHTDGRRERRKHVDWSAFGTGRLLFALLAQGRRRKGGARGCGFQCATGPLRNFFLSLYAQVLSTEQKCNFWAKIGRRDLIDPLAFEYSPNKPPIFFRSSSFFNSWKNF